MSEVTPKTLHEIAINTQEFIELVEADPIDMPRVGKQFYKTFVECNLFFNAAIAMTASIHRVDATTDIAKGFGEFTMRMADAVVFSQTIDELHNSLKEAFLVAIGYLLTISKAYNLESHNLMWHIDLNKIKYIHTNIEQEKPNVN
jgi:hypothetical protein